MQYNDISTCDKTDIVNILNSYFVSIGVNASDHTSLHDEASFIDTLFTRCNESVFFKPISPVDILSIVKGLKNSKTCGHDDLNSFVLKKIIHYIVDPLCYIFNMSLNFGKYPQSFKLAKVIPVFKKGNRNQCNNYRPISILPCISKILERVVYNQIYDFLTKHNIINSSQYGFRKGHSTDLAILDLYDRITLALSKKQYIVGVFLDLSKAFDTLNHPILLYKLAQYGIRGTPLAWFSDYLSNRKQYTEFDSHQSEVLNMQCGVPQGSILGPLLFLLYINDIVNASPILSYILFADDTTLLYADRNLDNVFSVLNNELPKLISWIRVNKLSLNVDKSNYILFHCNNKPIDLNYIILLNNVELEQKSCIKFLGIFIDEYLNWNQQYEHVKSQLSRVIGIMYKIKDMLPLYALCLLYKSFILSYLSYGNIAWGSSTSTHVTSLFMMQKRAVRLISGSQYLAHTDPIFKSLRLLKISDINLIQTAIFMYKFKQNILPSYFKQMFQCNMQIHSYNTRISENYHLYNPRITLSYRSIRHKGPDIWHTLPNKIRQCSLLSSFKTKLKCHVLATYD